MQTEAKLITLDEVNELLADIVSQVPEDYVYTNEDGNRADAPGFTSCEYASTSGAPSCLVGHVFHRLGLPIQHSTFDAAFGLNFGMGTPHDKRFTPAAVKRLKIVQWLQDCGHPWHEAIK